MRIMHIFANTLGRWRAGLKVFLVVFLQKKNSSSFSEEKEAKRLLGLGSLAIVFLLGGAALASESAPFSSARDTAALVSESDSFVPGKPLRVGLWLRLKPGWHTYWSNPGDAGAPPTLDITGAPAGGIVYPAPEKRVDGPFTSYAYTNQVLLPVTVTPASGAKTLSLDAAATWLVCAQICVPEDAKFHLELPAGNGAPGPDAALFAAADARTPRASPFAAHVAADGTLWLAAPNLQLREATFFPAEPGVIDQDVAQTLRVTAQTVQLALKPAKKPLASLAGVLALTDAGGQTEFLAVNATPAPVPAGPPAGGEVAAAPAASLAGPATEAVSAGLGRALLLAFAGGLILNLMPCVLPVLAMKALALARLGGAAQGRVRREAVLYTLGVLAAFGVIGGITLIARAAGGEAGWGVQFQSALFTTVMAWLLFGIGLNLSGVFEVGGGLIGAGQGLASRGAFFTGLLAVVVATPCTAPFMGAALAAALALPAVAGMLIFLALGLGLAAPYALLAVAPGLARLLPKPGAWMEVLKQVLAFPMYGAALWMVWVASQQVGPTGLAAVFLSLLLVGFAAWAAGRAQRAERAPLLRGAALAAVLLGLGCLFGLDAPAGAVAARAADGSEPFSTARLGALRAAHRPVLVDMSAAWCVTCLVNERVALSPDRVRAAFARHKVAYLKGDWTRQDAAITAYLKANGRSGVPLYVYYPAAGTPLVLPQILTPDLVIRTLEQG
jgi:thiol:disulfide interchange protein DsbD